MNDLLITVDILVSEKKNLAQSSARPADESCGQVWFWSTATDFSSSNFFWSRGADYDISAIF